MGTMSNNCKVKYQGGQNVCNRCGFVFDIDDDDPPQCLTDAQIKSKSTNGAKRLKDATKRLSKASRDLGRSTERRRAKR